VNHKLGHFVSGAVAAFLIFFAVPGVLIALVGVPLPHHWIRADLLSMRGAFDLLAVISWCAWCLCCFSLVRSVLRRVRSRDLTTARGARLGDLLSARIATAILVIAPALLSTASLAQATVVRGAPVAISAPMSPTPANPVAKASTAPGTAPTPIPTPASQSVQVNNPSVEVSSYTVIPGDSLWAIAQRLYGDGDEWEGIARLNLGHVMNDGTRFMDPNLIRSGWVLAVPGPISSPVVAPPMVPYASPPSATNPMGTSRVEIATTQTAPASLHRPLSERTLQRRATRLARHAPRSAPQTSRAPHAPSGLPLPELIALGMVSLTAAALARRVRKLRWSASRPSETRHLFTSEAAIDAETFLARFDRLPALDWFEVANRHLTARMSERNPNASVPAIRTIRIGPDGVEASFADQVSWAPLDWTLGKDRRSWLLSADRELASLAEVARSHQPWIPVAVPVGENPEGTWLVSVEPGKCLPVIGPSASALVAAMQLSLESWSWAEQVVVTTDRGRAEQESALISADDQDVERLRVVFVGDPAVLSAAARGRCSTITTLPLPASDLTIAVDTRAATIHPLGITLFPPTPSDEGTRAVNELLLEAAVTDAPAEPLPPPDPASSLDELAPPPVEVRLLTPIPRIEGLAGPLEAKRVRRATELVAYLALHRPDPVTSDRLRTRVLGNGDADAAAKTLFNTATAARRALGNGPDGTPYLPVGTKTGLYHVSADLGVDVQRAARLVNAAMSSADPHEAMALLRAALELIEGEPFSAALSGYNWWYAEGHGARVDALLVNAACQLAQLASEQGLHELSAWGLARARLVDPYSEELTRAAMRAAAAAGDSDWLRREWVDCQRRSEELDPGSLPSESTERVYAELTRRAPEKAAQANFAAIDEAPRSTRPSAPAAV
jgi:DNA-binding SARP family transcriptional activator/LysM repeat protein